MPPICWPLIYTRTNPNYSFCCWLLHSTFYFLADFLIPIIPPPVFWSISSPAHGVTTELPITVTPQRLGEGWTNSLSKWSSSQRFFCYSGQGGLGKERPWCLNDIVLDLPVHSSLATGKKSVFNRRNWKLILAGLSHQLYSQHLIFDTFVPSVIYWIL
jgi:hypothetical protein